MRLLHLADLHLDRPFVGMPRHAGKKRRQELFDAFRRCLALSDEHRADAITVGGDLWEEEHVTADTRKSVAHEFGQLEIPVLLICGNHDPLIPGGSYQRTDWPDNVYVFPQGRLDEQQFHDVSIWGISWGGGTFPADRVERATAPADGRAHLLLLHGTAGPLAALKESAHFPFDPGRLLDSGFGLCLAGHIHTANELPGLVYPGSPEPLGWGEEGRHGVALVEVENQEIRVELIDVNQSVYETREIDCTGCGSSAEVRETVGSSLVPDASKGIFLRVRLVGEIGPECEIDPTRLTREYEGDFAALVVDDRTEPLLDIEARAEGRGLEGVFVRSLLERLHATEDAGERRRIELAINVGLRAMDGREDLLHVD